jgi:hypothetical protein
VDFDHDPADLFTLQASLTLAGIDWGQELGTTRIRGRLSGTLTYHSVIAGCVKVRTQWRDANGNVIDTDFSQEVCSSTSVPSPPNSVIDTNVSSPLRRATVALMLKPFNGTYSVVASRSMIAGGN